jgi:hypothetical protein
MKVKILLVTAFAALVLLVAVPTGSALPPQAPSFSTVSCTVGTASFSFRLPSFAVPRFLAALDRIHEHFPGLHCTVS